MADYKKLIEEAKSALHGASLLWDRKEPALTALDSLEAILDEYRETLERATESGVPFEEEFARAALPQARAAAKVVEAAEAMLEQAELEFGPLDGSQHSTLWPSALNLSQALSAYRATLEGGKR